MNDTPYVQSPEWKERALKAERELAQLREKLKEAEEKEAGCCPEDVGFAEYIGLLKTQLSAKTRECEDIQLASSQLVKAANDGLSKNYCLALGHKHQNIVDELVCSHKLETGYMENQLTATRAELERARSQYGDLIESIQLHISLLREKSASLRAYTLHKSDGSVMKTLDDMDNQLNMLSKTGDADE